MSTIQLKFFLKNKIHNLHSLNFTPELVFNFTVQFQCHKFLNSQLNLVSKITVKMLFQKLKFTK